MSLHKLHKIVDTVWGLPRTALFTDKVKSHNRYKLNGKSPLIPQEEDSELNTPSRKAGICFAVLEAGRSETVIRASTEMNGKFLVALVMLH